MTPPDTSVPIAPGVAALSAGEITTLTALLRERYGL